MDQNLVATTARAVARRLDGPRRPGFAARVEAALRAPDDAPPPTRFAVDPVALASLVVSVATLGWTIFNDLRTKERKPSAEVLARRIRHELPPGDEPVADHLLVIDAVAEEIVEQDES